MIGINSKMAHGCASIGMSSEINMNPRFGVLVSSSIRDTGEKGFHPPKPLSIGSTVSQTTERATMQVCIISRPTNGPEIDVLVYGDGSIRVYDHDNIDPRCPDAKLMYTEDEVITHLAGPSRRKPIAVPIPIAKKFFAPGHFY